MSQVVESAHSCQSYQQDLYKSERGSHLVRLARIVNPVHSVARRSVFPALLLFLSLLLNTSAVISRLLPHRTFLHGIRA
jgi:hypothetical protein